MVPSFNMGFLSTRIVGLPTAIVNVNPFFMVLLVIWLSNRHMVKTHSYAVSNQFTQGVKKNTLHPWIINKPSHIAYLESLPLYQYFSTLSLLPTPHLASFSSGTYLCLKKTAAFPHSGQSQNKLPFQMWTPRHKHTASLSQSLFSVIWDMFKRN